jgi:hypothetical protein
MAARSEFSALAQVGKFSLWFSLVAIIGLLAVLWLGPGQGENYTEQIQSLAAARKNLPTLMWLGGLLLAVGTGLTTWMIVLYSSFRVAGPLYRFKQCFEAMDSQGPLADTLLRDDDLLQQELLLIQDKVAELYDHHQELKLASEQLLEQLERQDAEGIKRALEQLRETERWACYGR